MHPLGLFIFQASSSLLFLWVQVLWACQEIKRAFPGCWSHSPTSALSRGKQSYVKGKEKKKDTTIVSYLLVCLGQETRVVKLQKSLLSSDQEKQKSFWHIGFHLTVNQSGLSWTKPFSYFTNYKTLQWVFTCKWQKEWHADFAVCWKTLVRS